MDLQGQQEGVQGRGQVLIQRSIETWAADETMLI